MGASPAASTSPGATFGDFVPQLHLWHYLGPLVLAVLALVGAAVCAVSAIRGYSGGMSRASKVVGGLGLVVLSVWQGITFYDRLAAWAKPFGGVGPVLLVVAVGVVLLLTSDTRKPSAAGGRTYNNTYNDNSSRVQVRDSSGVSVSIHSPNGRQVVRQSLPPAIPPHAYTQRPSYPRPITRHVNRPPAR